MSWGSAAITPKYYYLTGAVTRSHETLKQLITDSITNQRVDKGHRHPANSPNFSYGIPWAPPRAFTDAVTLSCHFIFSGIDWGETQSSRRESRWEGEN